MKRASGTFRSRITPSTESYEFHDWPFYHVARVASIYSQRMAQALKPLGIDMPRWRVLMILRQNRTATVSKLSEEAVIQMSTMAKIVQRMTKEKLVKVQTSAEDARATDVTLAPQGVEILHEVQAKVTRISELAFDGVPDRDIQLLNRALKKIYANLSV